MTPNMVGFSFLILGVFLIIGKAVRYKAEWLKRLFLPSSIIAGFIALLVGPEVLGRIMNHFVSPDNFLANGLIPEFILEVWSPLPGMFINIIFAALFLGETIPSLKKIWRTASPQIIMGHTVAFGQYFFGLLLVVLVLTPLFGTNPMAGALIEIAFVGGHGTAAGLAGTFEQLNYPEGADLALGLATVGILTGVIAGIFLINYMERKGEAKYVNAEETERNRGLIGESHGMETEDQVKEAKAIEPLAFHFSLIAVAILIGYLIQQALIFIEVNTWGANSDMLFFPYLPLFPLAMIGGIIIQWLFEKFNFEMYIDSTLINKISGFALDILLVSSLATLSLDVIGNNIIPFLLISLVGIVWNIFAFMFLGPRMIPDYWFERGLGDFGQATGMTATGLLLMKVADPQKQTPALEGFSYKQILFEPFVGGGLVTSASLPLIAQFGAVPMMIASFIIMMFFLIFGLTYFKRATKGI